MVRNQAQQLYTSIPNTAQYSKFYRSASYFINLISKIKTDILQYGGYLFFVFSIGNLHFIVSYLPFVIYCWSLLTAVFKLIHQSNLTMLADLLATWKNMNYRVQKYVYSSKSFIFILKKYEYLSVTYIHCLCNNIL